MRNKDENKSVALGTSKINYMDPRVTVSWCKRNEVPIDKVRTNGPRNQGGTAVGCVYCGVQRQEGSGRVSVVGRIAPPRPFSFR